MYLHHAVRLHGATLHWPFVVVHSSCLSREAEVYAALCLYHQCPMLSKFTMLLEDQVHVANIAASIIAAWMALHSEQGDSCAHDRQ